MNRREIIALGAALAAKRAAFAQQAGVSSPSDQLPVVGVLVWGTEVGNRPFVDAIRDGMRDNGFVDGVNVRLRVGYADTAEQLPGVSRKLAALGSRLIVAGGTTSVRAAHESLPSMPIVMAGSADPVAMGLAVSLARPGGKVTGISIFGGELLPKWVELLKEIVPNAKAFAAFLQAANPGNEVFRQSFTDAARSLNIVVHFRAISAPEEFPDAFAWASQLNVDGLLVILDPMFGRY